MSAKSIYIVYETTNIVNGKYYIGKHKQNTIEFDGYLGSGELLKSAIKKYKKENFFRETLKLFVNEQDAYNYEKKLVNTELVKNPNCYNITTGGYGVGSGVNNPYYGRHHSEKTKSKISKAVKGRNNPYYGRHHSEKTKSKISKAVKGRKLSTEHKNKLSKLNKGTNNSMYGKSGKKSPRSKLWFINGKLFYSSIEAGKYFNVSGSSIRKWCSNHIPLCYSS